VISRDRDLPPFAWVVNIGVETLFPTVAMGAIAPVPQISAEFRCFSTLTWPELARRIL